MRFVFSLAHGLPYGWIALNNLDNVQVQLVVLNQAELLHDLEEEDRDHGRHNDPPQHVGNELAGALAPEVDRGDEGIQP